MTKKPRLTNGDTALATDQSHREEEFGNYVRAIELIHRRREIFEECLGSESARTQPRADRTQWLQAEVSRLGALMKRLRPSDCEAVAASIKEFDPAMNGRV